jgi:hypothetical protein
LQLYKLLAQRALEILRNQLSALKFSAFLVDLLAQPGQLLAELLALRFSFEGGGPVTLGRHFQLADRAA